MIEPVILGDTPGTQMPDLREAGTRVEELLGKLRAGGDDAGADTAEEIVRTLLELYGAGLERILDVADATGGDTVIDALAADPLVASILVLHGLHPTPVEERIAAAIEAATPRLGGKAVTFVRLDDEGVLHLAAEGCGCPSTTATVQGVIEAALLDTAPEVVGVAFVSAADVAPAPVSITIGPAPSRRVRTLSVAPAGEL